MSRYKLRPHHGLCISFFEGKGYSDGFVRNMTEVVSDLGADDPLLTLGLTADVICAACPNNVEGRCSTEEKVCRYDNAVLELCGIMAGDKLHWSEFSYRVLEKVIDAGMLSEVCKDCCWYDICSRKTARLKE